MPTRAKLVVIASVAAALAAGAAIAGHHKGGGDRGPRAEQVLERMDTDQDGKITLEEMKSVAIERFSRRDVDGDGTVSREDRKARRASDGDGVVTKEEFAAFTPERGKHGDRRGKRGKRMGRFAPLTIQEAEARAEHRFARLDADDKGYVTLDDLKARAGKRGKRRGHRH